jgi:hypothetical protein
VGSGGVCGLRGSLWAHRESHPFRGRVIHSGGREASSKNDKKVSRVEEARRLLGATCLPRRDDAIQQVLFQWRREEPVRRIGVQSW